MMMSTAHGGHVVAGLAVPQTAVVALPHSPCRPIPGHLPHHPAEVAASLRGSFVSAAPSPVQQQISAAIHPANRHMHVLNKAASSGGPDRYAPLKRLAMVQVHPPRNPNKPLTPFSIADILENESKAGPPAKRAKIQHGSDSQQGKSDDKIPKRNQQQNPRTAVMGRDQRIAAHLSQMNMRAAQAAGLAATGFVHQVAAAAAAAAGHFVRPWAAPSSPSSPPPSSEASSEVDEDQEIEVDEPTSKPQQTTEKKSPLDALLQMTSKTFDGMDGQGKFDQDGSKKDQLSLFSKSQPSKKRRKSRTAFTNQQIYELEKRFLYQKYLTPADRDEIAQSLGLSNAQVITWFQNRRAKLKRDLEELKSDLTAAKSTVGLPQEMATMFGSLEELQLFQKQNGMKKLGIDKTKDLSVSVSSTGGSSIASPPSSCGSLSPPVAGVLSSASPSHAPTSPPVSSSSSAPLPPSAKHPLPSTSPISEPASPSSPAQQGLDGTPDASPAVPSTHHSPISNAPDSPKTSET